MFKQILIILIILILVYFIIKYLLIRSHKLFLDPSKVKYTLLDSDHDYLKKYSKEIPIFELKSIRDPLVFYTNKKWSTKNNNYIKFKERYYIIEPGYYYYVLPETELFLNNNCNIYLKKIKR